MKTKIITTIDRGAELQLIRKIAIRVEDLLEETNGPRFLEGIGGRVVLLETIDSVHAINPIDLAGLATADNFNLLHDVLGMLRHYDWSENKLTDCFTPRYSI